MLGVPAQCPGTPSNSDYSWNRPLGPLTRLSPRPAGSSLSEVVPIRVHARLRATHLGELPEETAIGIVHPDGVGGGEVVAQEVDGAKPHYEVGDLDRMNVEIEPDHQRGRLHADCPVVAICLVQLRHRSLDARQPVAHGVDPRRAEQLTCDPMQANPRDDHLRFRQGLHAEGAVIVPTESHCRSASSAHLHRSGDVCIEEQPPAEMAVE